MANLYLVYTLPQIYRYGYEGSTSHAAGTGSGCTPFKVPAAPLMTAYHIPLPGMAGGTGMQR